MEVTRVFNDILFLVIECFFVEWSKNYWSFHYISVFILNVVPLYLNLLSFAILVKTICQYAVFAWDALNDHCIYLTMLRISNARLV